MYLFVLPFSMAILYIFSRLLLFFLELSIVSIKKLQHFNISYFKELTIFGEYFIYKNKKIKFFSLYFFLTR